MTVATAVRAAKSPLVYLKDQLQFALGEWQSLTKEDQEWYRQAAAEEMKVRGIEVK